MQICIWIYRLFRQTNTIQSYFIVHVAKPKWISDSTDLSQQATSIETSKSADREIFSEHEENAANEKCDEISNISSTASSSTRSSISSISAQYDNRERALCSTRSHRKFTYHNALAHVERTYYSPNYCPWYTDSSTGRENFDSTSDSIYSDSYESDSQSVSNRHERESPNQMSSCFFMFFRCS